MSEAARQTPSIQTSTARAYAAQSPTSGIAPFTIQRRAVRPQDVQIEILYCGVCHSDLHQVRNEWQNTMPTVYPCVPGHEITGRVVKAGSAVKKFKEGDMAAVGCMVDSDRTCPSCRAGEEQFCDSFPTLTYNAEDKVLGGVTYGGYSESIVVDEAFVLRVPNSLNAGRRRAAAVCGHHDVFAAAPLERWQRAKSGRGGARRAGAHGIEVRESPGRSRRTVYDLRRQDGRRGAAWAPTKWWFRKIRRRCRNKRAASTSSSTRLRASTT